ncbi:MerR family transcriptional regulator [Actinomyces massiliensis]|jgi:transcriptional regulator, MerR family|uniref:MerR HTH family regulatory protein n=1 Tax=Actinomyces massiliensis F0489 TaxID=1125718 RepID=J0NSA6_9ACTO|nr:MerR family transcriptional regulator [Actinomyces massiliensis]EJF47722.1 MerR HTH family regulatory protein [Actinomyces massiliensis F0489]WLD72791.1 MerR family transcriptional regulator [Actinomyces massiliensis]
MRVTQIADLAGTTPRAVRHYHRLGLLSVPPTVRGGREYGVEHLARLLRIRWLADGGLSLRQVAEILASDPASDEPPVSPAEARRRRVLHDLRAARGTIEAQRRSLDEQAQRVDELIARVEAGQALAPVPVALTRFYDAIEARVRALEEDPEILRTERQILQVLGSLGMVPDSAVPFVEALDEKEIELCAQQVIGFSRLPRLHGEEARQAAHALAERTVELSLRHKDLALAVLDDLPGGVAGRTLWHLTRVLFASGYPDPAQQAFAARLLELLLTSPDLAATFRRSVGEDPGR